MLQVNSTISNLPRQSHPPVLPVILTPPTDPGPVALNVTVSLSCTARGLLRPLITWQDGLGASITDGGVFSVRNESSGNTMETSFLEFVVISNFKNGIQYRCVAEDRASNNTSEFMTITVGGMYTFLFVAHWQAPILMCMLSLCRSLATIF